MLARIAPMLSLAFAVAGLVACTKAPATLDVPVVLPPADSLESGPVAVPIALTPSDRVADAGVESAPERLFDRVALPVSDDDATDYEALGRKHLAAGRGMEAVGALRLALSVRNASSVWQALGEAYLMAGDEDKALACLDEAVDTDVNNLAARRVLARAHLAGNDGAAARVHIDELLRRDPQDAAARQMLGRSYVQQRMWKEAIATFSLVLQAEPENIHAHNNLGYAAIQIGELELARAHLESCLSLEPQAGYMLNNLGVAYERLGRQAEAHAAFARAVELSPSYAQAKLNRDRLQAGLTQDERIVSAETLLQMRAPKPTDEGGAEAALQAAVDAATGSTLPVASPEVGAQ